MRISPGFIGFINIGRLRLVGSITLLGLWKLSSEPEIVTEAILGINIHTAEKFYHVDVYFLFIRFGYIWRLK